MCAIRLVLPCCIALLLAAPPIEAQQAARGLIDQSVATRYGLQRSWFAQAELDPSRGEIEYATLHVNSQATFPVFEVRAADSVRRFSSRHLDRFGDLLGREGAQDMATQWSLRLQVAGETPEIIELDVPEVTLYVQTSQAVLHAIDGETGRTRWAVQLGDPNYPNVKPGASDEYVATVNSSTLYLLKADTGQLMWEYQMRTGPGAGPAISDRMVFVPKINGQLEGYQISDPTISPSRYQSSGRTLIPPTVTDNSVSWPNHRGWLFVADAEDGEIRFRVETHDPIVTSSWYQPPDRLYFSSIDGYVYCVEERRGKIYWRYSTAQPLSQPAVPVVSSVYVVSEDKNLYSIDSQSGIDQWSVPHMRQFLAASRERVYCLDATRHLVILDAETGGRIGAMPVGDLDFFFINGLTDRIYLGTRSGLLQCLHETGAEFPVVHRDRPLPSEEPAPAVTPEAPAGSPPAEVVTEEPFQQPPPETEGQELEGQLEREGEAAHEEETEDVDGLEVEGEAAHEEFEDLDDEPLEEDTGLPGFSF